MRQPISQNKITKSVTGYIWQKKEFDKNLKIAAAQKLEIPDYLAEILAGRFDNLEDIGNYIRPTLKNNMSDPYKLKDMDKAVTNLVAAFKENKKITIFGDYDVDGGTSSALLKNYFKKLNKDCDIYIPDRIKEGYGPNIEAFSKLKELGTDLVITVDCGTTSYEAMDHAKEIGLEVIIIDHHLSGAQKPSAIALVNPNRDDESGDYQYLCAAGVVFLLIVALQSRLKKENFFKEEPNLFELLDLVALGTICDVVPLVGLNRAYVAAGLKILAKTNNIGIKALANTANLDLKEIKAYHLGFVLGPRINAGGRVGKSDLGAKLLSSDLEEEVYEIAAKLELHNAERKAIEAQILEEAFSQVENQQLYNNSVIIVSNLQSNMLWHPGVIGIVASRIKEKYGLPTAVIAMDEEGIGKASCRSIKGVDFGSVIAKNVENKLLINGGGHKMAAGFTVAQEKLTDFSKALNEQLEIEVQNAKQTKIREYEREFSISALNLDLCKELELLGPYGMENKEPRIVISNCRIVHDRILADKHLKLVLAENASGIYGKSLEAIIWNAVNSELLTAINQNPKASFSFLGILKINKWQEKESPQFEVIDILF